MEGIHLIERKVELMAISRRRFMYGLGGLGAVLAVQPALLHAGQEQSVTEATYGREGAGGFGDPMCCRWFDSVEEMAQDTSLAAGMYVETAGYYEPGDGGCAAYRVEATTLPADDGSVINLQNGLQAILIVCDSLNCKQFGAVGDGTTDDTAALQSAINVALALTRTLKAVQGETYKISSQLVINGSLDADFMGSTLDATSLPVATSLNQVRALYVTGAAGGSMTVTADIPRSSSQVMVTSTSGFNPGDLILLASNQPMMDGYAIAASRRGELRRIASVDSAVQLTLSGSTAFSYQAASGTTVRRIIPVQPRLRNLNIVCGGVGSGHSGVRIDYATQFELEQISVDGGEDSGIQAFYCEGGLIRGGLVQNSTSPTAIPSGNTGYGIVMYNATCDVIIEQVTFRNCRRGVTGGNAYPVIRCTIRDCIVQGGRNGLGNHEPCFWWLLHDNTIMNVEEVGITIRGQYTKAYRNRVFGAGAYGIRVRTFYTNPQGVEGTELVDNWVTDTSFYGIYLDGDATNGRVSQVQIRGGRLHNCATGGIYGRRCNDVTIDGVECKGQSTLYATDGNGIYFNGSAAEGDRCAGISISNVSIPAPLRNGISLRFCDDVEITGCRVTDAASSAVNLLNSNRIGITGGYYEANGNTYAFGIYGLNSNGIRVSGAVLVGSSSNTGSHAIVCTAASPAVSTDHEITGCRMESFVKAVMIFDTGVNHSVVTGNNARLCSSGVKFDVASANQVVANNMI